MTRSFFWKSILLTLPAQNMFGKRTLRVALVVFTIGVGGCQPAPAGFERFIPAPGPAREALVAVLDAWTAGRPSEEGVGLRSDVHVVDKQRKAAQRLIRYEVLGEVTVDKARGFAVRLSMENPDETPVVRFLVVGESPLWVWRQEDFEMIAHWMHPMDKDKEDGGTANPSRTP